MVTENLTSGLCRSLLAYITDVEASARFRYNCIQGANNALETRGLCVTWWCFILGFYRNNGPFNPSAGIIVPGSSF